MVVVDEVVDSAGVMVSIESDLEVSSFNSDSIIRCNSRHSLEISIAREIPVVAAVEPIDRRVSLTLSSSV